MNRLTALVRAARRLAHRSVPASRDNQPGTDTSALWTCRRIARQPLTDPDISRRANQYLRRKGDQP